MEPSAVVDLVNESGKVFDDISKRLELHRVYPLDLKGLHEAFRFGVVIRVSSSSHRTNKAIGDEELPIGVSRVLRSAIRVVKATRRRFAPFEGALER